jgi:hypothetical protein
MSLRETIRIAHDALSKAGIDHVLIGGFALSGHGVDRATRDIDLLIHGDKGSAAKTVLSSAGFVVHHETREVIQLRKSGTGDLDLLLAHRPLSQEMLSRAQVIPPLSIKCARAEDIIGLKIQAYVNDPKRELQDKADIQALISKCPGLDWARIQKYAELFGQWDAIQEIRDKA